MGWFLFAALAGSLLLNGLLLFWMQGQRADASRLRALIEERNRRLGSQHSETVAIAGDLSEGTLSLAHARVIADWVRGDYHEDWCLFLEGWPNCSCARRPVDTPGVRDWWRTNSPVDS